jgi:gamma-glutamyltranspeptidase
MSGTKFCLILAPILCSATSANAQLVERPLISGRLAVVTSDEPLASIAGMRILQEGGDAFDAAVATAVAVGVLDPRMSSIGGNGFATVYVSKTPEVRALNSYGSAPKRATVSLYQGKDYSHGFLSAPVPSCLKGYEALHKAYGRLPWAEVLQPAIELAENGLIIRQGIIDDIRQPQACQNRERYSGSRTSLEPWRTSRSTAPAFSIAARLLLALCSFTKPTVEHWVQKT